MISVIIPIYNAEKFISRSIQSAISQKFVSEVIVIDDYSTDDSFEVSKTLENKYPSLIVTRHPGGKNLGPAFARNYGISLTRGKYLAFLDADDFYLENRFSTSVSLLENESVHGVYEAIGISYLNKNIESFYSAHLRGSELTTISKRINPERLFKRLIGGKHGNFSLIGMTLRRSALHGIDLFDTEFRIGEDTDFIWRLALYRNLIPGTITRAVAIRNVHGDNHILKYDLVNKERIKLAEKWLAYSLLRNLRKGVNFFLLKRLIVAEVHLRKKPGEQLFAAKLILLMQYLFKYRKNLIALLFH